MELSDLERLALGSDRAGALAALMPGTTEHDYWKGVFLQHDGRLAEVDAILETWKERHRRKDDRYSALARRQLLLKARRDLDASADEIRRQTSARLDDRADVVVQAERFPTKLDPALIDDRTVVREAIRRRPNLEDLTTAALYELVQDRSVVRRPLVQRLDRADLPGVLDLVEQDLADKNGSNGQFGALRVHKLLTLEQLTALAGRMPALRDNGAWVDAVLVRLAPPSWVDIQIDREERARLLDRAYAFATTLAPAFTTLKAVLLYHRLELDRARGVYDRALFREYIALPRNAPWAAQERARAAGKNVVDPSMRPADLGLEAIGNDESLVSDYLSRFLLEDEPSAYADLLDRDWVARLMAMARLLAGATGAEAERCAKVLGPSACDLLREEIDIELAPQNPPFLGADDDVALEVDVKNVPELEVKVFRIDVLAHWLAKKTDVDVSIDLDGMIPRGEPRRLSFDAPPLRRQRVRIELPECKRPGTYIVELIGNGRSSRALLRKGVLRHHMRTSAAGTVLTITDDSGTPLPDARLWLGARELVADEHGRVTIPFATSNPSLFGFLIHGGIVQSVPLERPTERPVLAAGLHIERESLVANQTARILCRPRLTLGGAHASVTLLEDTRIEISVATVAGTSTTRTQKVELRDDHDAIVDINVPDAATRLSVRLRARVRLASRQETVDVDDGIEAPINVVHTTELTALPHLARVATAEGDRFVLSFLGKSGEPLARRAVPLVLQHRLLATRLETTLETNDDGEIDLGLLSGKVTRVTAGERSWAIDAAFDRPASVIHAVEGAPLLLPRTFETRTAADVTLMLVRKGAPAVDVTARVSVVDRCLAIGPLAAGDYELAYPAGGGRTTSAITIAPREGAAWTRAGATLLELPPPRPRVLRFDVEDGGAVLRLAHASGATRVHFVATRFVPDAFPPSAADLKRTTRDPFAARGRRNVSEYVSGRDLGDEYRYVLERRKAKRRPGMMLEKPSLLLHPWALRTTSTSKQDAREGGDYAARAMSMSMPAPAARQGSKGGAAQAHGTGYRPGLASVDFLPAAAVVVANARPDADGVVRVPLDALGPHAQLVQAFVVDPSLAVPLAADVALPAAPLRPRDLRLRVALDPAGHYAETRRVDAAPAGTALVVPDVRAGKIELVDTLARAHDVLMTLAGDTGDLVEFAVMMRWPALDDATRRALYNEYACHELHLFLWKKDRAFFDAVVRPTLIHKREKTFVDRFLLGEDLTSFLEPWAFGRLNAVERVLLGLALPAVRAGIARLFGDQVELVPPSPERDADLVATLLGSAALEVGGGALAAAAAPAMASMEMEEKAEYDLGSQKEARRPMKKAAGPVSVGGPPGGLAADVADRERAEPLYRGADTTQEWAERQWWKRRVEDLDASVIAPNRFWRDLAAHAEGPFLSPHLGDCAGSFAEAMCALAFLDLPFVATTHATTLADTRLTVTPASHALAAHSSIVAIEAGAPATVLVGQSYVRSDDRWEWDGVEQREKRVTGEMLTLVVYRCLVVVTNPTSASAQLDVLMQIPKGAMPVDSGFITRTVTVRLPPYGTHALDYAFYFPLPGRFTHFPAHVTSNGELLVAAEARALDVVLAPSEIDQTSWSHVSQHGSLADVTAFLERSNLGRIELARIAWRMHDRDAFSRVTDLLTARHVYDDRLWAYALLHRDRHRADEWLRHQDDFLGGAGLIHDDIVEPIARGWHQHLEYAPLINARAHQLGAQRRILNDALDEQYRDFLDVVAHRPRPTSDDMLSAAHYLLAMDRVEEAIGLLDRVRPDEIVAKAQFDYLAAYIACYRGELARARALVTPWLAHPVARWRSRFAALVEMLDEAEGTGAPPQEATSVDADQRDRQMAEAAARQPSLDIAVRGHDITLTHANVAQCQVRFFELDIELVFSRQPFVQSDVERFSFVEPGLVVDVPLGAETTTVVPLPAALRGKNLVIEAVATGLRRSIAHYAHDLGVQVAHAFGQLRVVRASTGAPLPAVYVKVYSREQGGRVVFYKDGYTDLRGRLDYATLSTDDLDRAERFALLVVSDDAGATITEAPPPTR